MAEQGVFKGIVDIIFEDEIGGEWPPFFKIGYDMISYFYFSVEMEGHIISVSFF